MLKRLAYWALPMVVSLPLAAFVMANYALWIITGLMFWVTGICVETLEDWEDWSYGTQCRPWRARKQRVNDTMREWFSH
jgi:steroid 5-alpha reductase family enzyme